jgi:cytochrome b561
MKIKIAQTRKDARMTEIQKFPVIMRLMHWSMAILLIGMLALGLYIHNIPLEDPNKFDLYHWHRAFGIVAFMLVIIRLVIRPGSTTPGLPGTLPWHERAAARSTQILLYIAMLSMPVLGYVASSAVPEIPGIPPLNSIWLFGAELPLFPIAKNYGTTVFYITIHKYVGYAMIAVIIVHVAGALKHRYFDRPENDVLSKML